MQESSPKTANKAPNETTRFQTREARRQALARARLGLPPSHPKERECLACDAVFLSLREERTCPPCRARNRQDYYGV